MALDEPEENEQPVQINGLDVLIEEAIRPFINGNTLDYVKRPDGEGFIMTSAACGSDCGSDCC
jgi:Fe-S cluster assembly iron-binding protein IscA